MYPEQGKLHHRPPLHLVCVLLTLTLSVRSFTSKCSSLFSYFFPSNLLLLFFLSCKGVNQRCCCDSRCAFPCDEDVPCVYSLLPFCTCCVNGECNVACCATINDVLKKGKQPLMSAERQQYSYNNNNNGQQQQPQYVGGQQQMQMQQPQVVTAQPM